MKIYKIILLFVFLLNLPGFAQQQDTTLQKIAPKIFFDCRWCDIDYIRKEINFVNYVYDRKNADIHIMVTTQSTGSGGREYTLTYIGQNTYKSINDTLTYTTLQDDTDDKRREKMVKFLKMGLIQYVAKTPIANDISVSYTKPGGAMVKEDHWNNWVFSMRIRGWFNGEKSSKSADVYARISANRITDDWKIRLNLNASYDENKIQYEDTWYKTTQNRKSFYGLVVKSLSDHWSFGGSAMANADIFQNKKASFSIYPAIEYNIFPYTKSTRRELRFLYRLGGEYTYYNEQTIFGKSEESFMKQTLEVSLEFKQPWGEIETDIWSSTYLHDLNKNRFSIYSDLSIRVFKGFSINMHGGFSWIRDQLFLRNEPLNKEDVLLRRYALQTDYDYWGSVGLEYSFGSIYNNIVNPRFGY